MDKPSINIVVIGEVGSGKSTTAAHLIHKLGGIHQRLVKRFEKEASQMRMSRDSLKYSWVLDKLESEKERGISIDNTIGRFETDYYYCTVIDAPGHPSSIKDTITAISHADAALLIIDSTSSDFRAGINSQTFEHALLAYGLGVKNIIPCCNKIDDTGYSQERYNAIVGELSSCLKESGYMDEFVFVPMSGLRGDNLFESSTELGWHNGLTLLEAIDRITEPSRPVNNPLRVPIQQFHKIFGIGTVAVGRVQAGELKRGMEVTVGPIGLATTVKSIEMHGYDLDVAFPGDNIKFNLGNIPIKDLEQGHVVSDSNFVPAMEALSFTATVMMKKCIKPITKGYTATMHCNMFYGTVKLDDLISIIDSLTGDVIENRPKSLKNGEVGIVKMIPTKRRRMVVETYSDCPPLGRFVLRDTHNTIAIGLIKSVEKKDQSTELNMRPRTPEKLSATIEQQERSSTLAVPSTSSAIEKLPTNSTTTRRIPLSLMPLEKEYDIQFQQEQEASAVHDYPSASSNI